MTYIHERKDWPRFRWDASVLAGPLADVSRRQGRLLGRMERIGLSLREDAALVALSEEAVKSSAVEGETLDPAQVRSSIARQLGLSAAGLVPADRRVDGVVEMLLDATRRANAPLTEERLFAWHGSLFPTGTSELKKITVGAWRTDANGPMQVVSGAYGKRRVHFEAPAAGRVLKEMKRFLVWFESKPAIDPILKAGLAHFWFVTIHPFDDGNGRIARAIADMALARGEKSPERFYSISSVIRDKRNAYYQSLENAQKADLDVTEPMLWFINSVGQAIDKADAMTAAVLVKADFWDRHRETALNERQRAVINRLFGAFEGKLTTSKWAKLTKVSQDTAARDIADLIAKGVLRKDRGGGRSTSYSLIV